MAGYYVFEARQGDSFSKTIRWKNRQTGSPVDITGYAVQMILRTDYDMTKPPALLLTQENGYLTVEPEEGTIHISLPKSVMENISPFAYLYEMDIDNGLGVKKTVLEGRFWVKRGVL